MRTQLKCIPCFARFITEVVDTMVADEPRREAAMRELLELLSSMDFHRPPPFTTRKIQKVLQRWSENPDPYREEKALFNRLALSMLENLKGIVARSDDQFTTAARIAIAGNILDPAIVAKVDERKLIESIEAALSEPPAIDDLELLRARAAEANDILYLGDNAGEIVLDTLLISALSPHKITYAVRGGPILNDATREDAVIAGIADLVRVIDNGDATPGTLLDLCSPEFCAEFESADLIISKGQGNFETLNDTSRSNVFFLLKAKCPIVAEQLGVPIGSVVVKGKI